MTKMKRSLYEVQVQSEVHQALKAWNIRLDSEDKKKLNSFDS